MSFYWDSDKYHFSGGWSSSQIARAKEIIQDGYEAQVSKNITIKALKEAGLGYRRINMLEDLGRAYTTEKSLTMDAYERENAWYDMTEEIRHQFGLANRDQAMQMWTDYEYGNLADLDEIQDMDTIEGEYYIPKGI